MAETEKVNAALLEFGKNSPELRERIVAQLETVEPALEVGDLARRVAELVGVNAPWLSDLLESIASVTLFAARDEQIANSIADFLSRRALIGAKDEEQKQLASLFARMLKCENSLGITGKAQTIMWGHGRIFKDAHTITQIRPIFSGDVSQSPLNAVIVHELRLDYRDQDFNSQTYLHLDSEQLLVLRSVLDRALAKEETLRQQIPTLTYLASIKSHERSR